ncbi:MAG: excinuclease ABC subunit UvrC [Myxococcales bacterium]|nr:excinuclease ABC subunit UvrC [Myxococcales bacterium]MDH5306053.1 excinuclease ABC subunit UvrC [Myxococcales bacterium]MDH5566001.1 excinuclease ABC subunit UvrC [Myxococcales bacterium]
MGLAERAASLPTGPGVYLFKSDRGRILYVGKAQNLRVRVRQYVGGGDGRPRIPRLVEQAADVDVVLTPSVKDALLLENELIKRHKPPFNVRLRDDKQYLALRLDPREAWPRLTKVRRFADDGASYFGPYTSSTSMREALSNLHRIFPLRTCSNATFRDYARRGRPCIEYEMKRCPGPCCERIGAEDYARLVHGTVLFLRGRSNQLMRELEQRMAQAAEQQAFEAAAHLRDQIGAVERTLARQQIVAERLEDRDVFGLARDGGEVEVHALFVRDGRVVGSQGYALSDVALDDGELLTSFLGQYYGGDRGGEMPREVLAPLPLDDDGALEAWLRERTRRRVAVRTPRRGALRDLVAMASSNAALGLARRLEARESVDAALEELRERLGLRARPRRIEGYDVSTLHGTLTVASRVVFEDGQPARKDYRRYRIREAAPDDDCACLREVLQRRLARAQSDPLPDLLMVDGGKGQLAVLSAALADAGLELDAVGLAKEREASGRVAGAGEETRASERSREAGSPRPGRVRRSGGLKAERIFLPQRKNPVLLMPRSRGLLLLQRVRDEAHRFALEFQRSLRSKANFTSILEELPGIGPSKRSALLKHLGSLRAVREASAEALAAVPGISLRDARVIRGFFDAAFEEGDERV